MPYLKMLAFFLLSHKLFCSSTLPPRALGCRSNAESPPALRRRSALCSHSRSAPLRGADAALPSPYSLGEVVGDGTVFVEEVMSCAVSDGYLG